MVQPGSPDTEPTHPLLSRIKRRKMFGVEVFATGTHTAAQGVGLEITVEDLDGIVEAFNRGLPERVPVKFGHSSEDFNLQAVAEALDIPPALITGDKSSAAREGAIAAGWVVALERRQNKLYADFDLLEPVAQMIVDGLFEANSVELMRDQEGFRFVMRATSLLGVHLPAVKSLAPLQAASMLNEQVAVLAFRMNGGELDMAADDKGKKDDDKAKDGDDKDDDEGKKKGGFPFAAMDEAFDSAVKGKRGASTLRAAWSKFKNSVKASEDSGDVGYTGLEKLSEGGDLPIIAKAIGLSDEASMADVIVAFNTATKTDDGAVTFSQEQVNALVESATAPMKEAVEAMQKGARLAHFSAAVSSLDKVPGTVEEMATELVEVEEKMGAEAATKRLADMTKMQEFAEASGAMTSVGATGDGTPATGGAAPSDHDYEAVITKYSEDNSVTRQVAMAKLSIEDPVSFAEYIAVITPRASIKGAGQ